VKESVCWDQVHNFSEDARFAVNAAGSSSDVGLGGLRLPQRHVRAAQLPLRISDEPPSGQRNEHAPVCAFHA
jgi:hypothetical protein